MVTRSKAILTGAMLILILWSGLLQVLEPTAHWLAIGLLAFLVSLCGGFVGRRLYRFQMTHIGTLAGLFAGFLLLLLYAFHSPLALDSLLSNAMVMWAWTVGGGIGSYLAQL